MPQQRNAGTSDFAAGDYDSTAFDSVRVVWDGREEWLTLEFIEEAANSRTGRRKRTELGRFPSLDAAVAEVDRRPVELLA